MKQILQDALIERRKAQSVINGISDIIKKNAEKNTFDKYKNTTYVSEHGIVFELIGVRCFIHNHSNALTIDQFTDGGYELTLMYVASIDKNKLPKAKRDRILKIKLHFLETGDTPFDFSKNPVVKSLRYNINLDEILENNINLKI